MSTSQELITQLRELGVNMESIGQALGRDRSLISQVSRGKKPGNNLAESLAALRDRLTTAGPGDVNATARAAAVAPPARRTTGAGRPARVRRSATVTTGSGSTSTTVKRSGSRGGARSAGRPLLDAIEAGSNVAFTATFTRRVNVSPPDSKGRKTKSKPGPGGTLTAALDPDDLATVSDLLAGGASPAQALAALSLREGWITGPSTPEDAVAALISLEVRTWT